MKICVVSIVTYVYLQKVLSCLTRSKEFQNLSIFTVAYMCATFMLSFNHMNLRLNMFQLQLHFNTRSKSSSMLKTNVVFIQNVRESDGDGLNFKHYCYRKCSCSFRIVLFKSMLSFRCIIKTSVDVNALPGSYTASRKN